ncbi:TPA: ogr/Delta-like zinc finger family protein [Citrobacter freundii]|nr:ogr/Delta-like zinc finger family protein [Citrobacter freundii]
MRIKCPACQGKTKKTRIVRKENNLVEVFCDCQNPDCSARFVTCVEYLRHVRKMRPRAKTKAPEHLLMQVNALTMPQQQDLQARITWKTQ